MSRDLAKQAPRLHELRPWSREAQAGPGGPQVSPGTTSRDHAWSGMPQVPPGCVGRGHARSREAPTMFGWSPGHLARPRLPQFA